MHKQGTKGQLCFEKNLWCKKKRQSSELLKTLISHPQLAGRRKKSREVKESDFNIARKGSILKIIKVTTVTFWQQNNRFSCKFRYKFLQAERRRESVAHEKKVFEDHWCKDRGVCKMSYWGSHYSFLHNEKDDAADEDDPDRDLVSILLKQTFLNKWSWVLTNQKYSLQIRNKIIKCSFIIIFHKIRICKILVLS